VSDADELRAELQVAADALSRSIVNLNASEERVEEAKKIITLIGMDASSSNKPDQIAKVLSGIMIEMSILRRRLQSMTHEVEMWQERL
jgi:FtsZ-binding cell division protein ZapB